MIGDTAQAQFFDQAILQGLVGTFDAAFGLGGVGTDQLNVQFIQGAGELGDPIALQVIGMIDAKNAEFIAVKCQRASMLAQILLGRLEVTMRRLGCGEEQGP